MARIIDLDKVKAGTPEESVSTTFEPADPVEPGVDAPCLAFDFYCCGTDSWCGIGDFACGGNEKSAAAAPATAT